MIQIQVGSELRRARDLLYPARKAKRVIRWLLREDKECRIPLHNFSLDFEFVLQMIFSFSLPIWCSATILVLFFFSLKRLLCLRLRENHLSLYFKILDHPKLVEFPTLSFLFDAKFSKSALSEKAHLWFLHLVFKAM